MYDYDSMNYNSNDIGDTADIHKIWYKCLNLLKKCLLRCYVLASQSFTIKIISLRNEPCIVRPIFSKLNPEKIYKDFISTHLWLV